MKEENNGSHFSNKDRELMQKLNDNGISLNVKVDRLITDFADINRNFSGRISALEVSRIDRVEFEKAMVAIRGEIVNTVAEATKEAGLKQDRLEDKVTLLNKIVYGCVGLILIAFVGALISMVIKN